MITDFLTAALPWIALGVALAVAIVAMQRKK